MLYYNWEMHVQ